MERGCEPAICLICNVPRSVMCQCANLLVWVNLDRCWCCRLPDWQPVWTELYYKYLIHPSQEEKREYLSHVYFEWRKCSSILNDDVMMMLIMQLPAQVRTLGGFNHVFRCLERRGACYPHGYNPSQLCDTFWGIVCDTSLCMSVIMSHVVYIWCTTHMYHCTQKCPRILTLSLTQTSRSTAAQMELVKVTHTTAL